jgi:Histidine kinase-, DNA gyrase B-, and HSP90-like ATPase
MSATGVPLAKEPNVAPAGFVAGGTKATDINVDISYRIIDRFSEGLYSSPNKAFEELVSNSYDAGARRVWARVPDNLDVENTPLAVIDDGVSMDLEGMRDLWQIGVSSKRGEDGSEKIHAGRRPIGKFGIGKLATYVLARELTYVCRADGAIRAVTMDYSRAEGELADPHSLALEVVDLTADQARETLEAALGTEDGVLDILFGDSPPETWTAAILTGLKDTGLGIQRGRLRWILRTALPLGDHFELWLNSERLESSKISDDPAWEFVIGESDKDIKDWGFADLVAEDDGEPGLELEHAGFIHGTARVYDRNLKGGKSEEVIGRSHGIFVKVRERLINLDDEEFGIDVELSRGVLAHFRMEVHADGLDPHIASPRESVQESAALKEVQAYILAVFNRARSWRTAQEAKPDGEPLSSSDRVASPPPALSTGPLRRVLRRAIDGDKEVASLLDLDGEEDLAAAEAAIATRDSLLKLVVVEALGHETPLVQYDVERRAAIVNADHPFVSNYVGEHEAGEPLRLVGVTELLTQVYMLDEDLDPQLVRKILKRRDEYLRALVNIHPRSSSVVARQLRDSKGLRDELEDAVADALELLGFEVTRIGGNDNPDGIARASLGPRAEDGSQNYSVTYDAKSSGHPAIKAKTVGTSTLKKHRESHDADYSLVVAPGYEGGTDSESSISKTCRSDAVTPLAVEQLAELVELFPFRGSYPVHAQATFRVA